MRSRALPLWSTVGRLKAEQGERLALGHSESYLGVNRIDHKEKSAQVLCPPRADFLLVVYAVDIDSCELELDHRLRRDRLRGVLERAYNPDQPVIVDDPTRLKLYPELGRVAILKGAHRAYRLWLIARHLDRNVEGKVGSGWVPLASIHAAAQTFGITKQEVTRTLQDAIWFEPSGTGVIVRSLRRVCLALETVPGDPKLVEYIGSASVLRSTTRFKQAIYEAWLTHERATNISRDRLATLFGITDETQRRWERRRYVTVTANYVEVTDDQLGDEFVPGPAQRHIPRTEEGNLNGKYDEKRGVFVYQTVNSYQGHVLPARRGMVKGVTKSVRAGLGNCREAKVRVFFTEEDVPDNYQNVPGHCLRVTESVHSSVRRNYWSYSTLRPSKKGLAVC